MAKAGNHPVMEQIRQRTHLDHVPGDRTLRRIIVTAALVFAALVLLVVAVYAGAFLLLAPMMQ